MAAHRATKAGKPVGTLVLDRILPEVGRIRRASGVTSKKTRDLMNAMLTALSQRPGGTRYLVAIRDGHLSPRQVYDAYTAGALESLPTPESLAPLADAWAAWMARTECGEEHRKTHAFALARLMAQASPTRPARVGALPALLAAYRDVAKAAGTARAFNLTRNSARVFARETGKRSSALYQALGDVDTLTVVPKRKNRPLTVAEFDRLRDRLADQVDGGPFAAATDAEREARAAEAAGLLTTMCATGMHWKEISGDWRLDLDAVRDGVNVRGTKRASRVRDVPRVLHSTEYTAPHLLTERAFAQRLESASVALFGKDGRRTVYDLRRTYAVWMEGAGIERTRRRIYLGHAAGDMTERYERHEVTAHLAADAQKLRDYLDRERAK